MKEALKGFDLQRSLDVLVQCGALPKPGADGRRQTPKRLDGAVRKVYEINPERLEDDHGSA